MRGGAGRRRWERLERQESSFLSILIKQSLRRSWLWRCASYALWYGASKAIRQDAGSWRALQVFPPDGAKGGGQSSLLRADTHRFLPGAGSQTQCSNRSLATLTSMKLCPLHAHGPHATPSINIKQTERTHASRGLPNIS